jgi:Kef-type K+ transport system membrane component KefB
MDINLFCLLSLVIVLAVVVSGVMRLLKQPLIVGYILTGMLLGPAFLNLVPNSEAFSVFSNIGITLLLFIIGLGLNTAVISRLGKVVLFTAGIQMLVTLGAGYLAAMVFGFGQTTALIVGVALMFSSTIIIIKVLNDKREQGRLYAQISIGMLLLQDIVASIALVLLAAGKGGDISPTDIALLALKGIVLALALLFTSTQVLSRLSRFIAESQEFLFLFTLGWGFGIATLFELAGFSIEVGALFAGVSLASLPYAQEAAARLKPLRDFFVVVFFIALGEGLNLAHFSEALWPAIAFSAVIIFVKPFSALIALGGLGYTKQTSFKSALTLSQVSEFSLIFVVIAAGGGLVSQNVNTIITLTAIITIAVSTYLMKYDDELFSTLEHSLRFFERKVVRAEGNQTAQHPLILFGYHKGGSEFIKAFKAMRRKFIVVDYNPEAVEELERQNIEFMYGDATDLELLEELNISKTKLIVSTITDFETNQTLLAHIMRVNPHTIVICHSDNYEEAASLYHLGATYVMMPHLIGSERISNFVKHAGLSRKEFDTYRQKHLILLESQLKSVGK